MPDRLDARTRGVAVIDAAGIVISHNRSFPVALGEEGSLGGRSLRSLIAEDEGEALAEALELVRTRPGTTLALHAAASGQLLKLRLAWLSASNEIVAEAIPTPTPADAGSLSNLAAGIAHDFNNLLTVIQANLRKARELAAGDQEQPLESAQRAVPSAAVLSRRLMALGQARESKLGSGALAPLLRELESLLHGAVPAAVSVETSAEPGLQALSSPGELEQVLLNLAVIGAETMQAGGWFRISADEAAETRDGAADRYVRIRVQDEGAGMDAATAARAMEPYFSTKGAAGTGLGLAIAQQIVAGQGGTLSLDSEPGKGTTVTVLLPRSAMDVAVTADAAPPPIAEPAPDSGTRVLVVDDRAEIRAACVAILREEGYAVQEAADGSEATSRAEAWQPTLVVLDATMPGLSGAATFEVLSRAVPAIRAVFISGFGDEALARLDPSERWTFVAKPFDRETLLGAVSHVLATSAELAS